MNNIKEDANMNCNWNGLEFVTCLCGLILSVCGIGYFMFLPAIHNVIEKKAAFLYGSTVYYSFMFMAAGLISLLISRFSYGIRMNEEVSMDKSKRSKISGLLKFEELTNNRITYFMLGEKDKLYLANVFSSRLCVFLLIIMCFAILASVFIELCWGWTNDTHRLHG